ncbi:hypothetical protein B0T22DRAFT_468915 [Podospora appendiculata]|uniref:Uncharacterized protein n=1 Tax=Podospora appendiculata TaxID=314037 RepID=A0AAE1C982_9PEZI|nr:hypothetical protein B0T22DRAFT_468915 [Podospora appendiculata]
MTKSVYYCRLCFLVTPEVRRRGPACLAGGAAKTRPARARVQPERSALGFYGFRITSFLLDFLLGLHVALPRFDIAHFFVSGCFVLVEWYVGAC